jgi:hypothetical protein
MSSLKPSVELIEVYKGEHINRHGKVISVGKEPDHQYVVALDDSKRCGHRLWDESANTIETARRYIDWKDKPL